MRRVAVALALAITTGAPVPARAQTTSAELLSRAKTFYAELEIERALPLLRQLLSPGWPFEISRAERVEAYTYLGAALALAGRNDSALVYFSAALEWDPFTDLNPARFTPAQARLFGQARTRTFAAGLRPVATARVDPRTEFIQFTVATTHAASLDIGVRHVDSASATLVHSGENSGLREVRWNGLVAGERLAAPGRYELTVAAASRLMARGDTARAYFDLRHEVEPLEDTLPDLGLDALLPERRSASAAAGDLARGAGVAATALLIGLALWDDDLGGGVGTVGIVAGVATVTGIVGFARLRRHPEIPENVATNARRRLERQAANDAIRLRNNDRIARTILLVDPAAGAEP
jgi:tetratricopeptide (TPR) repeat protein